jgi:hypothetical protein
MIPKSGYRFSERIMLKPKNESGMVIRRKVILFQGRLPPRHAPLRMAPATRGRDRRLDKHQ